MAGDTSAARGPGWGQGSGDGASHAPGLRRESALQGRTRPYTPASRFPEALRFRPDGIPRRALRLHGARRGQRRGDSQMYAVIRTGGKQYKVAQGDKLRVEKLPA